MFIRRLFHPTATGGDLDKALAAVRETPKIEVPSQFKLDNPEKDGPAAIERLRYFAEDFYKRHAYSGEIFERIVADMKEIGEAVAQVPVLRKELADAQEMAKVAQELAAGRGPKDDAIVRDLRGLAFTRQFTDEDRKDFGFPVPEAQYNVLQMTRDELRQQIGDGEGYNAIMRLRYLNDVLYTVHQVWMASRSLEAQMDYRARGGMKTLKHWPQYERIAKLFSRTFDTSTSGEGSQWVPTMYSTNYFEDITHPTGVLSQYQFINMPQNPWGFPFVLHGQARDVTLIGESTGIGAAVFTDVTTPASANFSVTARKHGRMSTWSREIEQDSIIAVVPIFTRHITTKHRYALADAIINGQTINAGNGTLDTGRAMTANSDVRDSWSLCSLPGWGLRRSAHASATEDFGGTMAVESLAAMRGKHKQYGNIDDAYWLGGYSVAARMLVLKGGSDNSYVFLTREKAGEMATAFTGTIGMLMGSPLVVDGMYPEDLNATGIYDNVTTNKTSILLMNRTRHTGFVRQGLQLEQSTHAYFPQDLTAVRSTFRVAFSPYATPSTTERVGVAGFNIPSYS